MMSKEAETRRESRPGGSTRGWLPGGGREGDGMGQGITTRGGHWPGMLAQLQRLQILRGFPKRS